MDDLQKNKAATRAALELLFSSQIPFDVKKHRIGSYINPSKYVQHSPELADGLQGLMDLVASFDRLYRNYSLEIKRLFADADYTIAHCHYRFGDGDPHGKAIVEIFRFEHGLMVEHWDVIQPVPETETAGNANGNGMF